MDEEVAEGIQSYHQCSKFFGWNYFFGFLFNFLHFENVKICSKFHFPFSASQQEEDQAHCKLCSVINLLFHFHCAKKYYRPFQQPI